MSGTSSPSDVGGGSDMFDGLIALLRPAVEELNKQLIATRESQVTSRNIDDTDAFDYVRKCLCASSTARLWHIDKSVLVNEVKRITIVDLNKTNYFAIELCEFNRS